MSPSQFSDVNTLRFIYSRTGLHPQRLSFLISDLLVFQMDFNCTRSVTTAKVNVSKGLFLWAQEHQKVSQVAFKVYFIFVKCLFGCI